MLRLFLPFVCCLAPILVAQEVSLQTEAARFATEATFFENTGKWDDALEKLEVAYALEPKNVVYRERLFRMLYDKLYPPITSAGTTGKFERDDKFEYDWGLHVVRIDAETMQQAVQAALRLESLADYAYSFANKAFNYYDYHYVYMRRVRQALTTLAEHVHPEFKDEVRAINRRALDYWMKERCQNILDTIVDQQTFRRHFHQLEVGLDAFAAQTTTDLVVPFTEFIETVFCLTQNYELDATYQARIVTELRVLTELYDAFALFVVKFRAEDIAETDPEAAARVERTVALLEEDSRRTGKIYAWLARNRIPKLYKSPTDTDRRIAEEYVEKLKSYLTEFPQEMIFTDHDILYRELYNLRHSYYFPGKSLDHLAFMGEIIELADSRREIARNAVQNYIQICCNLDERMEGDESVLRKLRSQYDPLVLCQLALAENTKIDMFDLPERAMRAGIVGTQEKIIAERPWKEEIVLMSGGRRPIIRNNTLYQPVARQLVCLDLETLDKRSIPLTEIGYAFKGWSSHNEFCYVDDVNAYFQTNRGLSDAFKKKHNYEKDIGLYVFPLDGSNPWSLTLKDDLPSNKVSVLGTLDGWCYVKLDADWIIRVDIKTGKWEQLSSSRAKTGKTPFVDGKRLSVEGLFESCRPIDDPKRERILLLGETVGTGWAIQKDGSFVDLGFQARSPFGFFEDGDKLLYKSAGGNQLCVFDFKSGSRYSMGLEIYTSTACVWNGYIWGGMTPDHNRSSQKWGRRLLDKTASFERLPIPEETAKNSDVDHSRWLPKFCAPAPNGTGLIVDDGYLIILLRFE